MKCFNENSLLDFSEKDFASVISVDTFIITRFNLRLWSKDKNNKSTLSDEWLSQRFELFEEYCFPSIKAQTNKEFVWMCMFDELSTLPYLDRVKQYHDEFAQFLPLFLDENDSCHLTRCIDDVILKFKDASKDLITMRVDNDDALHIDFVAKVKEYAEKATGTTIYSFKYGIQYYVKEKLAVHIPFYNNHFLCMVNKNYAEDDFKQRSDFVKQGDQNELVCSRLTKNRTFKKVKHVLEFNHFDTKHYPYPFVCNSEDKNMWVEVIHATNVSNDCKMTLNQGPIQEETFLVDNYNVGGVLPYVSRLKFWRFMSVRFIEHIKMKISSKLQRFL